MIVAVCSDKGAPGVTTLATVMAMVWPGGATVLEADPSGGDLTFRLRSTQAPTQEFLLPEPSVFTLATDARTGLMGQDIARYGQVTTLGVRVVPGPLRAERTTNLRPLWPMLAHQLARSEDMVIVDLGRVQPGHAAWPLAQAATVLLVLARPDPEGLYHLRERAAELAHDLGDISKARNPVGVVILAEIKQHRTVMDQVEQMFNAAGLPIPVAGWMADDRSAAAALREGELTRTLRSSALLRSVSELATSVPRLWPHLLTPPASASEQPTPDGSDARRPIGRQQIPEPWSARSSRASSPSQSRRQEPLS